MEKSCRFSYNDLDDSLIVSCKDENENVRENFMFDNFIFNLTGKGKIVGLQIKDASKVFLENNISKDILKTIEKISIITVQKENCLLIALNISSAQNKVSLPLRVFMPQITA